jgi:anti-anti-sigma factor
MDEVVGVKIERLNAGEVIVARLTGELDIAVAESVGGKIGDAVPSSALGVVVDMTGLDFIDSSGVSMLFGLVRQVGRHRQALHVVAPEGKAVARVLEIVEFERAAPIYRDAPAAIAAVSKPRGPQQPPG